jgi:hypothetical protein
MNDIKKIEAGVLYAWAVDSYGGSREALAEPMTAAGLLDWLLGVAVEVEFRSLPEPGVDTGWAFRAMIDTGEGLDAEYFFPLEVVEG